MKKILFIFLITITVISCSEDMLNRYPTTSMVIENFYKTTDDATQALVAVYNMNLRENWWGSLFMSEVASDNCAGGSGSGDGGGYQRWDRGLESPDANANQNPWAVYYGAIFRANVYLENEGLIDWKGNEALQIQYQAEARFLRAYFHFYLTRLFGEIPALTRTLAPDETPARTPAEELYTFIINDLKFCVENGLSAPYGQMNPANWGHATKWAAEAMIARVYLFYSGYYNDATIGDFTAENARAYIDDVIANSGHDLVSEFASLWLVPAITELGGDTSSSRYIGEVNPEVVWSVRYERTGNPYEGWHRMIGPRYTVSIDPYGRGWGAYPVLPALWNAYDTADYRKTATILSWDDEGLTYDYVASNQAQYTGYNPKKYELISVGGTVDISNFQTDGYEDFMVIRYADVLLMGAELRLITGDNSTQALDMLNKVRERAFGDASHNYTSLTIDNILTERRFELACEGLRYWDILRSCKGDFSKLVPILTYIDETDGGDYSQTADVNSLDVDGNNFVPTKGLFQIPRNEIDLMLGAIEQNPGYTGN
jgi:hypothetical protein